MAKKIEPGHYELRDPKGKRRGGVQIEENGHWNYIGDDGGRNRGTYKSTARGDGVSFTDDRGNNVAVVDRAGIECEYDDTEVDPKTKKTKTVRVRGGQLKRLR